MSIDKLSLRKTCNAPEIESWLMREKPRGNPGESSVKFSSVLLQELAEPECVTRDTTDELTKIYGV